MFLNAKKNVLCEKPLAMNLREAKEMVATAKTNNVFLMEVSRCTSCFLHQILVTFGYQSFFSLCCLVQAVWTRFFPASLEISRLLAQEAVGEVKLVRADFGACLKNISRSVEKELGGGALLDIGIYCLQFVLMVYDGEKPESIQASGVCLDSGRCLEPLKNSEYIRLWLINNLGKTLNIYSYLCLFLPSDCLT